MSYAGWGLIVALTSAASDGGESPWPARLRPEVIRLERRFPGEIAFFAEDVRSGLRFAHNADRPAYLASGIKLVVMVALFRALAEERLRLDETIVYHAHDIRDGTPVVHHLKPGTPVPLHVLLEAMIQLSDNAATDLIIRRLGLATVNATLAREGLSGFGPITSLLEVRRLVYHNLDPRSVVLTARDVFDLAMEKRVRKRLRLFEELVDVPAGTYHPADYERAFDRYYREGWNSGTMRSMGRLLRGLVQGEVVNPEASSQMLRLMHGTRTGRRRFRAGLPEDVPFAHKTGTQRRRTCDFGVIFVAANRPVVVAASLSGGSRRQAEEVLARLAKSTYSVVASAPGPGPALRATQPAASEGFRP